MARNANLLWFIPAIYTSLLKEILPGMFLTLRWNWQRAVLRVPLVEGQHEVAIKTQVWMNWWNLPPLPTYKQ